MKKLLVLAISLFLALPFSVEAQKMKVKEKKNYVKMKPKEPTYTREVSPGPDYTYIREDWTWDPATNTWTWYGNRWMQAPATGQHYVPGHWMKTSSGWYWQEGYWK
jgi:hypothetical protein